MSVLGLPGLQETQTEKGVSQKPLEHLAVLNSRSGVPRRQCLRKANCSWGPGSSATAGTERGEEGTKREDCETKKPGKVNSFHKKISLIDKNIQS